MSLPPTLWPINSYLSEGEAKRKAIKLEYRDLTRVVKKKKMQGQGMGLKKNNTRFYFLFLVARITLNGSTDRWLGFKGNCIARKVCVWRLAT